MSDDPPDIPDVLTISIDWSVDDPQPVVDHEGIGTFEALGILVAATLRMAVESIQELDE